MDDLQKTDDRQNKDENGEKEKPGFCIIIQIYALDVMNAGKGNRDEKENPSVLYFILFVQPKKKNWS